MRHLLLLPILLITTTVALQAQNRNIQVTPDSIKFKEADAVKAYIRWDGTDLRIENDEVGDSDIVLDAENDLFFFTNDLFRNVITKDGDSGWGTATPSAKIDVEHNSSSTDAHLELTETQSTDYARIKMTNSGVSSYWDIAGRANSASAALLNFFYDKDGDGGTVGSNVMTIDGGNERVGIGTTSPLLSLDVRSGGALFSDGIGIGDTDIPLATQGVRVEGKSVPLAIYGGGNQFINWYGVNGTNPRASIGYISSNGPRLEISTEVSGQDIFLESAEDISFWTGLGLDRTIKMFLHEEGNFSIGNSFIVDNNLLNVTGDIALTDGNGAINFYEGNSAATRELKAFLNYSGTSITLENNETNGDIIIDSSDDVFLQAGSITRITILDNGNVGIGRTPTTDRLEVQGDAGKTTGGTAWNTISDSRLKKDIRPFEEGLEILSQIDPVWFKYNGKVGTNPNKQEVGIIAQDIKKIAPYMVGKFVYKEQEEDKGEEYLSYNSNALQYIIVNSIQELAAENDKLKITNDELKKQNEALEARLARIEAMLSDAPQTDIHTETIAISDAQLQQNQPNPFSENTTINYFIPAHIRTASLRIADMNGSVLKDIIINEKGAGQIELQAHALSAGSYTYTLVLDGQVMQSKQMVLTK